MYTTQLNYTPPMEEFIQVLYFNRKPHVIKEQCCYVKIVFLLFDCCFLCTRWFTPFIASALLITLISSLFQISIEVKITAGYPIKQVILQEVTACNPSWVILDR